MRQAKKKRRLKLAAVTVAFNGQIKDGASGILFSFACENGNARGLSVKRWNHRGTMGRSCASILLDVELTAGEPSWSQYSNAEITGDYCY